MYISMKFGTVVHVFCWEFGVFNRSCFRLVSCISISAHISSIGACNSSIRELSDSDIIIVCISARNKSISMHNGSIIAHTNLFRTHKHSFIAHRGPGFEPCLGRTFSEVIYCLAPLDLCPDEF